MNEPLGALQFTATVLSGPGIILPLYGMLFVAQRADATMDRIVRLSSESLDRVLVVQEPGQGHQHRSGRRRPEVARVDSSIVGGGGERTAVGTARPTSSVYSEPLSWGGSTVA